MKKTILMLMAAAGFALAQTPNTNDTKTAWNVQFNYSTNQWMGMSWAYKQFTNAIPLTSTNLVGTNLVVVTNAVPVLTDWHRDQLKGLVAPVANSYYDQRTAELNAKQDVISVRQKLPDATQAQIDAIKTILGL